MSEPLGDQELLRKAVDHPGSLDWKGEGNPWRAEVVGIWRDAAAKWADFLDDPVAAIRAGVESGTIKGEEIECLFCEGMGEVVHDIDCEQCVRDGGMAHAEPCPECRGSAFLRVVVIGPVSDGGSET